MDELELFSEPWAEAYEDALNANEAYAEAGASWEGPMALLVRKDPAHGIEQDRGVLLDLWQGECREARSVAASVAHEEADHVIVGDRSTWTAVLEGRLQPLKALMFGKLKLEKGNLRDLLPYTKAAKEMVESAREVPTRR